MNLSELVIRNLDAVVKRRNLSGEQLCCSITGLQYNLTKHHSEIPLEEIHSTFKDIAKMQSEEKALARKIKKRKESITPRKR